jgi:hypothetical protein
MRAGRGPKHQRCYERKLFITCVMNDAIVTFAMADMFWRLTTRSDEFGRDASSDPVGRHHGGEHDR